MSAKVTLTGMDELVRELKRAPATVQADGMQIVRDATETTAATLRASYPRRTGVLASRVRTVYPSATILLGIVQSRAPHAGLWHFGTKQRRTRRGYNRGKGPPANPEPLVPVARRERRKMIERLKALVARLGFEVTSS